MKTNKLLLKIDLVAQMVLMSTLIAAFIIALFTWDDGNVEILFNIEIALGVWQVGSALIMGVVLRDKERFRYLKMVFIFFVSIFLSIPVLSGIGFFIGEFLGTFTDIIGNVLGIMTVLIMLFGIPLTYAWWYLFKTYADYKGSFYKVRNFWDVT